MEFTQWTEAFSVGDPLMDAYHHIFFRTLDDLSRDLTRLTPEAVEERIAFLLNYAIMHFDSEERLMREVGYPELERHQELHRAYRERLSALQARFLAVPSEALARELVHLSETWLRQHILGEDMKYKPYLKR